MGALWKAQKHTSVMYLADQGPDFGSMDQEFMHLPDQRHEGPSLSRKALATTLPNNTVSLPVIYIQC
jgi:hypothetical protein